MNNGTMYTFAGETGTLSFHARRFGIEPKILHRRVNRLGWSLHEAIHTTFHGRSKEVSAFGQSRTIRQWAEANGLTISCIQSRLRRGWDEEDAVGRPSGDCPYRQSSEQVFEWQGREYNIAELAKAAPFPIRHEQMRRRLIVYGWSIERAMTEEVRVYKKE